MHKEASVDSDRFAGVRRSIDRVDYLHELEGFVGSVKRLFPVLEGPYEVHGGAQAAHGFVGANDDFLVHGPPAFLDVQSTSVHSRFIDTVHTEQHCYACATDDAERHLYLCVAPGHDPASRERLQGHILELPLDDDGRVRDGSER